MSNQLVKVSEANARERKGFVKGAATGAIGATVLLTFGFWPTVIVAGCFSIWKVSGKVRDVFSGKKP